MSILKKAEKNIFSSFIDRYNLYTIYMKSSQNIHTEIEIKLALPSFCDYLKLIGFIGKADSVINQRNIFYDTDTQEISKLGYALRLRIESNRGIVTLKSTTIQKGKAAVRDEIEETVSIEQAADISQTDSLLSLDIAPIRFLLAQSKNLKNIKPILQFANERIKKEILLNNRAYLFEVDKTMYVDSSVDYELEIELATIDEIDFAVTDIQHLFKSLEIDFLAMKKSKFERALEIAGLK